MEHVLETEFEVPLAQDEVFGFFSRAENLQRITPAQLRFEIITPLPIEMRPGALIDYRLRLLGFSFGWRTVISRYEPPHFFVDQQLRGPYRLWIHTHTFESTGSGTRIHDHVRYRLPLYPLGEPAHPIVRMQLRRIFAFRQKAVVDALTEPAPGNQPSRSPPG